MAAATAPSLPIHRLDVDAYDQMVASGALEGEPVELLEGLLVEVMSPQSPAHAAAIERLTRHLGAARARLRVQLPLALPPDSEPEPDLALVEVTAPNLPAAVLGTSRGIEPGEPIGVAGYPIPDAFEDEGLGVATSVYAGRVSSLRKDALELDLPVIPGESGGPVFDVANGTVIALAESRFDEEKAIGFGIPIDDARRFLQGKLRGTLPTAPPD